MPKIGRAMSLRDQSTGMSEHELLDFVDARILAARNLKKSLSNEDHRNGYGREQALQEVRMRLVGERLPDDARCEHDWPDWSKGPNPGELTRACRRCELRDYEQEETG